MKGATVKHLSFLVAASAAFTASAAFQVDRSAMSDRYWAVWNDGVQAKIDADIEKYRKADATVAVAAPDGAEVAVEQVSHAFFFGAHIFNFNQLGKKEWNDRYKELYGTLFNSATVAFYWRTL
ncbi:MAG: 1,4-beta-xylanase, partial [Kiritimatiellia bacterium]|nr:1,4-beta-xylanase [Kiritimatiellia bacterium]